MVPAGSLVLDVGCGTGEDALFLAEQGRRVHGIDVSEVMLRRLPREGRGRGIGPDRLATERRAAEDLAALGADRFDAAYSDFGALNCADLAAVGTRPGAGAASGRAACWCP